MSVFVVDGGCVTAFGPGLDLCWSSLIEGRSALREVSRFPTDAFSCHLAATAPAVQPGRETSLAAQLLAGLFEYHPVDVPPDAYILLATATGEIDFLEKEVEAGKKPGTRSHLATLHKAVCAQLTGNEEGAVVSSACASATVAAAQGAAMIESGERDCVVVVAVDAVSEFVFSGFASLGALDPDGAKPFDANRNGLTIGEAAGFLVLMNAERAHRESRVCKGVLSGWGMTNDANHMTGPSRDGDMLAAAIQTALRRAGADADEVKFICAHGTGTTYNDGMEMKAFHQIFSESRPVFSIKGAVGHSMGASGLLEILISIQAFNQSQVPPTVGLREPDANAAGWVFAESRPCAPGQWALSTNSGFGGINAALVLKGGRE